MTENMRTFRSERIEDLIQQYLGELLVREFDFDGALTTIKSVEVDKELLIAKVKIGVIPFEKELATFILIDSKKKELQGKLLRKLNIRPLPQIKFEIDR